MQPLSRRELFSRLMLKKPAQADIVLSPSLCLAWNGTLCASCRDACGERAISFFGVARPTISLEKCTRCGDCVPVCPAGAITLRKETV